MSDKSLVVMVKDAKFIDLKSLVDFMYHGEVSVEQDRLNSLLRTAESLKVKGLADEKKKEERLVADSAPVHVPVPQAVPGQKRVMHPVDQSSKRVRTSAPFAQSRSSSQSTEGASILATSGEAPKQEIDLTEDENGNQWKEDENGNQWETYDDGKFTHHLAF